MILYHKIYCALGESRDHFQYDLVMQCSFNSLIFFLIHVFINAGYSLEHYAILLRQALNTAQTDFLSEVKVCNGME